MTAMPGASSFQFCINCSVQITELDPATRCRSCGGLLELRHRAPEFSGPGLRRLFDERLAAGLGRFSSGVWRYRELVLPGSGEIVTHPEGNTPLLSRPSVAAWTGLAELSLKHEGHNPTGSFKDRGMTVGVTQARRIAVRGVVCASTGNTSASLAAYAAQAGLPAFVLVPAGKIALGKLAQTVGFGAQVLSVQGDFDACLRLVEEAGDRLGLYLLNSVNPFRIEGQKTIVFELLQQREWQAPDWIVLPGGNLGNTAAFGKALEEARRLDLIDRMPRLAVVQAEGAAPFARSFAGGFKEHHRVRAETIASAIRIGDPASWDRAVRAILLTDGVVLSVSDAEILAAKATVDRAGVGCEPASAASVAGVRRLVRTGVIGATQSVVAVLTGHMLKDPEILLEQSSSSGRPPIREIEPTEAALAQAIEAEASGYNSGTLIPDP